MEIENTFKQDAKTIVDMLFDAKLFKDKLTRDDMNGIEDFIGSSMSSRFSSVVTMSELVKRIESNKQKP